MEYVPIRGDAFDGKRQKMVDFLQSDDAGLTSSQREFYEVLVYFLSDMAWLFIAWGRLKTKDDARLKAEIPDVYNQVHQRHLELIDYISDKRYYSSSTHYYYVNILVTSLMHYFDRGYKGLQEDWNHPYGVLSYAEAALAVGKHILGDYANIARKEVGDVSDNLDIFMEAVLDAATICTKAVITLVNKSLEKGSSEDFSPETYEDTISQREFKIALTSFCRVDKIIQTHLQDLMMDNVAKLLEGAGISIEDAAIMPGPSPDHKPPRKPGRDDIQERLDNDAGDFLEYEE